MSADAGRAWLALSPTILLVILTATRIIREPVTLLVLLTVCLTSTFGLYIVWVRLVPDQITSADMLEQARARAANHHK